jgi:hypothetical protein
MSTRIHKASELDGSHIGEVASFPYVLHEGQVDIVVTGEIREIHHDAFGVTLWVAGLRAEGGEKQCFENLAGSTEVNFEAL